MVESTFFDSVLISWIVISVSMFIGELFVPQFFLFWFGIGAIAALVSYFLLVPYELQWGIFAIVSVVGIILTRPFVKAIQKEEPRKSVVGALIGERMEVTKTIDNIKREGQVHGKSDYWRAISNNNIVIESGTIVEVIGIEGVALIVKPIQK